MEIFSEVFGWDCKIDIKSDSKVQDLYNIFYDILNYLYTEIVTNQETATSVDSYFLYDNYEPVPKSEIKTISFWYNWRV